MAYLVHHGILGQKWGVRRYQNEDGTLTEEGRRRRGLSSSKFKNEDGSLTRRGKLRKFGRDVFIGTRKSQIAEYKADATKLKDLKENRRNSKYYYDSDPEMSNWDYAHKYGYSKDQDLDWTIQDLETKLNNPAYREKIDILTKEMESVKNTPIDQLSFAEESRNATLLSIGMSIASTAGGYALMNTSNIALGLGTVVLGSIASSAYNEMKIQELRKKYNIG